MASGGVWMFVLGVVNVFYLDGSDLLSVFCFGVAGLSFVLALAELVLARVIQRSIENARPS